MKNIYSTEAPNFCLRCKRIFQEGQPIFVVNGKTYYCESCKVDLTKNTERETAPPRDE